LPRRHTRVARAPPSYARGDRLHSHRRSLDSFTFNPRLAAYTLANVRVGVTRGIWEYALFINNLTNVEAQLALDRERGTLARVGYLTNPPRTFGARISFNQ
jgi:iron complex outermembrane receptor protein